MVRQSAPEGLGIVCVDVLDGSSAKTLQDGVRIEIKEGLHQRPMSSVKKGE